MSKEAVEQRARDIDILRLLKKGKSPATVIEYVQQTYDLSYTRAYTVVYHLNSQLKKSIKELSDEAASYITATLINEIEECGDDGDRKNKLKALELLAKVCKVGDSDGKLDLNVQFNFDNE